MPISDQIKKYDLHQAYYQKFRFMMQELQPLAFLIAGTIIMASFLQDVESQKYAILSGIFFFFAYIGLASYRIFEFLFIVKIST